jgi:Na+/H+ antiporter NhaC
MDAIDQKPSNTHATTPTPRIEFRGGPAMSIVPLALFVLVTLVLVIFQAPKIEGMIVAAMIGISAGMVLARGMAAYNELIFSLMANRVATVAVVCWLWAGAFAGILGDSGLVEAIVWLGWKMQLTGALFTACVFVSAALFAVSVGTGLGTIAGFTAVLYPAGLALGAHPGALMGAIISGAALGDNLAPISDTTIVSATTQETDVGGVVKSRLKYVLIAAGISIALFFIFGGTGQVVDSDRANELLSAKANPLGLPMLIPGVLVFIVAISGGHFLGALTAGIVASLIIGPFIGTFELGDVFGIADGKVVGSAVDGAMGMVPTAVLTLLLVSSLGLLEASGFLDRLMERLHGTWARSVRGAEASIIALISFANLCVSVNTVAMITMGPVVNRLRKRHAISSYRAANLLDTVSCSFPYVLPYAASITVAIGIQQHVHDRFPDVPVLSWWEQARFAFYAFTLFPIMILAVITGFGRNKG